MVCNIMSFLVNVAWYSLMGYRVGDADGTGKLAYLVRQLWTRMRERRLGRR